MAEASLGFNAEDDPVIYLSKDYMILLEAEFVETEQWLVDNGLESEDEMYRHVLHFKEVYRAL